MDSGYQAITPIQLSNIVWAVQQKQIRAQSSRVYFGCFVLLASRLAAARVRRKRRQTPIGFNRFRIDELVKVTGLKPASVRRGVMELEAGKLISFSEQEISIATEASSGAESLISVFSCRRSPKRPIPVPRAVLRHFATSKSVALVHVMIAYLLRGLSISRKAGIINNRGTVKASWIAENFGLSIRTVRYVRRELYREGWVTRDTKSFQRKLNRDGAYFVINADWTGTRLENGSEKGISAQKGAPAALEIAPLLVKNCTPFAPPRENEETSNEIKNQKARSAEPDGVWKGGSGGEKPKATNAGAPSIRRIVPDDLRRFDRLQELYAQAVRANWLPESEANALNFVAAAVRAREAEGDAARIFVSLVRRGLWQNITQAQEERARKALARFRDENPGWFLHSSFGSRSEKGFSAGA